ncbi:hypothetical protein P3W45_001546 [Vairimorpha bombi]|jgi:amino acid permease
MKSSFSESLSIYINLLKTTMGCGILKYPYLFQVYGIIPCILLTIISALSSYSGIVLYIDLNDKYGRNSTLSTVSLHFKPYLKLLADIVVIFKCYTVSIAYLVYLKSQLIFLTDYYNLPINVYFLLLLIVILISPFILMNKLDKLKYTSSLGLLAILFLMSTSLYRYLSLEKSHILGMDSGNRSYINNLCHFVFSFTCHQNIFTAQNEMISYNSRVLKLTALFSFISASLVYLIFGLISYMAFGDSIQTSFIDTHPSDGVKVSLSIFYIFLLALSIPLQTNPCKQYLLNMVNEKYLKDEKYKKVCYFTSVSMILSIYLLSCTNIEFDSMCKLIGGTFSTCMCFIFAGMYHFLSCKMTENRINNILAVVSLSYGVLSFCSVLNN